MKIRHILAGLLAACSIGAAAPAANAGTINVYTKCQAGPCYGYGVPNHPIDVTCSNGFSQIRWTGDLGAVRFTGISSSAWCRVYAYSYNGWRPSPQQYIINNFSAYQTYGRTFYLYR